MKPYVVLDTYYPPFLKCWKIGEDLTRITRGFGLRPLNDPEHPAQAWAPWSDLSLHAEVKNWTPDAPVGREWHQDGDTTPGSRMDCRIVLWANYAPTQFKFNDGNEIFQPQPFELIIFDNRKCYHRQPPNAPDRRYIFRQRVEK